VYVYMYLYPRRCRVKTGKGVHMHAQRGVEAVLNDPTRTGAMSVERGLARPLLSVTIYQ
jgi:hypothetical protein